MGSKGGFMKTPSYELGVQLDRNWVALKAQLDFESASRLNENFDIVYDISRGDIKRTVPALLKLVASGIPIPEAPSVKIADCFKVGDGVFAYRDPDFDRRLPKTVPAVAAGNASMFELFKGLNFKEMAEAHLNVTGSLDELKKALIERGQCWGPKQIDELIRQCKKGENPLKLRTDSYSNLFFMEVDGNVSAVHARRYSGGWYVHVLEFAYAYRWFVGDRVSFRNC
jgi:hypothetical protein